MKTLLLALISILALNSYAQNVNIPDANFKAYLVGNPAINTNGDAEIQFSEASVFIQKGGPGSKKLEEYLKNKKKARVREIIEEENTEEEPIPVVTTPPPVVVAPVEVDVVEEEIIDFPDVQATFPGGAAAMQRWIADNIKYPQTAIEMNEQGRVYLSFVVEPNGSITNISIERGVSSDLDREAKRLLRKMPKWTAGEARGGKVRSRCRLPINFQLD